MNREIKFRAWDTHTKQMIATGFDVLGETTCFNLIEQWLQEHPKGNTHSLTRMNDVVLMQFTGLKDKNGTEIYHKDLLEDSDGRVWLVDFGANTFDNTIASWTIQTVGKKGRYPIDKSVDNFQVIGNIYENPELLSIINPKDIQSYKMKRYKLKKDITDPRWTIKAGEIFYKRWSDPDCAYTLSEGVHPLHPSKVENNPDWFELVSDEGVGRIVVMDLQFLDYVSTGAEYRFVLTNTVDIDKFHAIREAIEDVLNVEHDMGEGLMAMMKMKAAQWGQQVKDAKIYTQSEMDAARTEAFNAARENKGMRLAGHPWPYEYRTVEDYLSTLSMSKYPASASKKEKQ